MCTARQKLNFVTHNNPTKETPPSLPKERERERERSVSCLIFGRVEAVWGKKKTSRLIVWTFVVVVVVVVVSPPTKSTGVLV